MKLTLPKLGIWSPPGTSECLEFDNRGQNTSDWGVIGVIGKVLKCRCPKWPCIGHLDICNPSYGQKKGRESNWQFDSRPLKVGNRPLPDVCRWSAMGRWKALEEGYNFGLNLTPIRGQSQELWVSKVPGVQPGTVSGLQLGTTTTNGYFVIHISSQTTKKEVPKSPHLRTIIIRKLLTFCDTITFAPVQSQVLHNSRTWYHRKTFLIIIASIYNLRLTLHRKLFATNPSPQRLSELTQKSISFRHKTYRKFLAAFWES
jgi:hypothetical protein